MAIKFEHTEVVGWEHAIRGMRNPMNSWNRSDSLFTCPDRDQELYWSVGETDLRSEVIKTTIGPNDHDLMMRLANGGPVHAKYRRMIAVYMDITAPLYWWKEFDTYKIGTVANSCSTMHKIAAKEFTLEDFSYEHLTFRVKNILEDLIDELNHYRNLYLNGGDDYWTDSDDEDYEPKDKRIWWQMIQLLPSSYNQKRTIMLNYEVLNNIYHSRKDHKLDEWREFCEWIEGLPYSELITGEEK